MNEVWVGDYRACDAHLAHFHLSIHIWRPENWKEGRFCRRLHAGDGPGLRVHWLEGQRLADLSIPVDEIAAYAGRPGRLLVHCAGGICRSLSLAVVAKVARGCCVFDAIRDVYKGIWPAYHNPPDYRTKTMEDIINWSFGIPPKAE